MKQNLKYEENPCPICEICDQSGTYVLFFMIQLCMLLTGFIGFLEQFKGSDKLVCKRFLRQKARAIFEAVRMGGKSLKQEIKGDANVDELVAMESNYSILDLREWHSSSIGLA